MRIEWVFECESKVESQVVEKSKSRRAAGMNYKKPGGREKTDHAKREDYRIVREKGKIF